MDPVEKLVSEANQKGLWGDYRGAISILDKAITKYPFDSRLLNNRSFYNLKLKYYDAALKDAKCMLKFFSSSLAGLGRKAEALMELKRYEEAEQTYRDMLELDPTNEEVKFWLSEAQICQLDDGGRYWLIDVKKALELSHHRTKEAKELLTVGIISDAHDYDREDVYYSDDDWYVPPSRVHRVQGVERDPLKNPQNPYNSNSLWVGNVTKAVTAELLTSVFSRYGKIASVVVQHPQRCAFVNYTHPSMAANALRRLPQRMPLEDTCLVANFPKSAKTKYVSGFKRTAKKNKNKKGNL